MGTSSSNQADSSTPSGHRGSSPINSSSNRHSGYSLSRSSRSNSRISNSAAATDTDVNVNENDDAKEAAADNSNSNSNSNRPFAVSDQPKTTQGHLEGDLDLPASASAHCTGSSSNAPNHPSNTSNNNNNINNNNNNNNINNRGGKGDAGAKNTYKNTNSTTPTPILPAPTTTIRCINPASDVNGRLDTQVEVRVYPCNNTQSGGKKKFTTFNVKPEGVIIQGSNRNRSVNSIDLGTEYATQIGRKLQRYELSDTRACQLLVTTHAKSFWVVPAPEAFSRHSGTCRLLGDRKHPPASHTLQVGDFLRVGSVGVVVIETHDGVENRILSEERIQKIMKDTTSSNGGFLDLGETDGENSEDSMDAESSRRRAENIASDVPVCYMCFDEENTEENPLITPCKCIGDTRFVHVDCLRKWHTAEADDQICFLSSVDATCSVCKSTFKSDFKLSDGRSVKLFKSSLEPPYVSLLVATKHEMAQRLFNTRFQLSFSTLMKSDGRNAARPLLLGRSSGSDMVLDYRTVSARHASIRFKNGEFIFTDAGSSNGSYLYLRRPVELSPSQPVQFRLGRSMIAMKVVNKWNRRLLRAVRRTGSNSAENIGALTGDDASVGSNDDDVRITDGRTGSITRTVPRRSRDSIIRSLPPAGQLPQNSKKHLDLLYALAYPCKRSSEQVKDAPTLAARALSIASSTVKHNLIKIHDAVKNLEEGNSEIDEVVDESKMEESEFELELSQDCLSPASGTVSGEEDLV